MSFVTTVVREQKSLADCAQLPSDQRLKKLEQLALFLRILHYYLFGPVGRRRRRRRRGRAGRRLLRFEHLLNYVCWCFGLLVGCQLCCLSCFASRSGTYDEGAQQVFDLVAAKVQVFLLVGELDERQRGLLFKERSACEIVLAQLGGSRLGTRLLVRAEARVVMFSTPVVIQISQNFSKTSRSRHTSSLDQ